MDLARELLDVQLVDQRQRDIGRADGVVLQIRSGKPPRLIAIEVGIVTIARRLHPKIARLLRALAIRWASTPLRPMHLGPQLIRDVGVDIELEVEPAAARRLLRAERWLRRRVIDRLPWSGK